LRKQITSIAFLGRFKHWSHMNNFYDVFTFFLGLESCSCVAVNGGTESSQILVPGGIPVHTGIDSC